MQTIEEVKKYLMDYLTEEVNNQKVICISGRWGIGKTYFWKDMEKSISEEKEINVIYYSVYGKNSIEDIEIDLVAKITKSWDLDKYFSDYKTTKALGRLVKTVNRWEAKKKLKDNDYIICLDDFERKSEKLDLNDLFGLVDDYISAEGNKLKIVLIFNHEEFNSTDGRLYRRTKEKIISKFIEFNPSIEELFELIFYTKDKDNNKVVRKQYAAIEEYKEKICTIIKEIGDRNGRTYKKILDNIVEWKIKKEIMNEELLFALIMSTMNFIYHNIVLECKNGRPNTRCNEEEIIQLDRHFIAYNNFEDMCICAIYKIFDKNKNNKINIVEELILEICLQNENNEQEACKEKLFEKKDILFSIFKYGFLHRYDNGIHPDILTEIHNFVKTGIL